MKECSAKYEAGKGARTLGDKKWNDFRKAQCGAEATAARTPSTTPIRCAAVSSNSNSAEGHRGQAVSHAGTALRGSAVFSQRGIVQVRE
jgi:hypothetical protein